MKNTLHAGLKRKPKIKTGTYLDLYKLELIERIYLLWEQRR